MSSSVSSFKKKGQGSIEFIGIMSVMFLIFIAAFSLIQSRMGSVIKERNDALLGSVANVIRSEIDLANYVDGEYYREFYLPEVLDRRNYSITMSSNSDVLLTLEDASSVIFLNANITGNIAKGRNIIKKSGLNVSINY